VQVREEDTTAALVNFEEGVYEELGRIRAQLDALADGGSTSRGDERD
jgi:hypothetical protein